MNQCNDPPHGGEADSSSSPLSRGVPPPPQLPPPQQQSFSANSIININGIADPGDHCNGSRSRRQRFLQHLSHGEIEKGITIGHFYCGTLRVHPHKPSQAHVTLESPNPNHNHDHEDDYCGEITVLIPGHVARNRALHGDRVVIALAPQHTWKPKSKPIPIRSHHTNPISFTTTTTNSITTNSITMTTNNNHGNDSQRDKFCQSASASAFSSHHHHHQHSESSFQTSHLGNCTPISTATIDFDTDANHNDNSGGGDEDEEGSDEDDDPSFSDLINTVISDLIGNNDNNNNNDDGIDDDDSLDQGEQETTYHHSPQSDRLEQITNSSQIDNGFQSSITSASDNQNLDIHTLMDLSTQLTPIGYVVGIQTSSHRKDFVGSLRSCHADHSRILASDRIVLFQPINPKFPRMMLPIGDCPRYFLDDPQSHSTDLFVVRLSKWSVHSILPTARFKKLLGPCGDLNVETESILIENGIDFSDFPSKLVRSIKCHEKITEWKVPKTELKNRRDLRKKRIFTIDPSDTKDIDDALSITVLPNGQLEIGVHIADVSFFVEPNSQLDLEARSRAIFVYFLDCVVPMLPAVFSENFCSLCLGVDRLAFLIFWRMNCHGDLLNNEPTWFGKTVIRSCAKLDYHIVQQIIEGQVKTEHQMPAQFRATDEHSTNGMLQDVVALHKLASKIRETRFQSGALHLSRAKFKLQLDEHTQQPANLEIYEQKDSNRLVEEFMLLANYLVARQLVTYCGDLALLRRHADPRLESLKHLQDLCKSHNIDLNVDSSEALHRSLQCHSDGGSASSVDTDQHRNTLHAIQFMVSKTMRTAQYCCSGQFSSKEWHHYALNFPLYTHFTSPIRRYTDIIVHRLLEWVIEKQQQQQTSYMPQQSKSSKRNGRAAHDMPPFIDIELLKQICRISNQKKLDAKRAQDQSALLLLLGYLASRPEPLVERGVVCGVRKKSLSVFLPRLGIEVTATVDQSTTNSPSIFDTVSIELACLNTTTTTTVHTLTAKLVRE